MVIATPLPKLGVPCAGPLNQSVRPRLKLCVVPSLYVNVPVPLLAPLTDAPRKPSMLVPAGSLSGIVCPRGTTLSKLPGCTFGQANVRPPLLTLPPGITPAACNASKE